MMLNNKITFSLFLDISAENPFVPFWFHCSGKKLILFYRTAYNDLRDILTCKDEQYLQKNVFVITYMIRI